MTRCRRGFTLVEMLVVIGIIGVLAALLLPAVMAAVNAARRATIAADIAELNKAIESYREKHGDYPPNFRDYPAFIRHVNKCYPQASKNTQHMNLVIAQVWGAAYSLANQPIPPNVAVTPPPSVDEGESLVFWLYLVDNDKREPFKALLSATPLLAATSPEKLYTFKEERLIDGADGDALPAYKASYSGETAYLYLDSRSYDALTDNFNDPLTAAYSTDLSAGGYVRPYWTRDRANTQTITGTDMRPFFKAVNPSTFQIICAGQDGLFGADGYDLPANPTQYSLRYFPSGSGYNASGEDNDNFTNFSAGKRLQDHIE